MRDLVPFSYPWIFKNSLKNVKTILDVGSGKGEFVKTINYNKLYIIDGVELFKPYIKLASKTDLFRKIFSKDITKLSFNTESYDAVICNQVIEHLNKREGFKMIEKMEKYARKTILIGTPNGHWHQDEYDNNKLQEHRSHWEISDFKSLGYTVRGQGLKLIYSEKGLINNFENYLPIKLILYFISYLMSPIIYYFPSIAAYLVAIKTK